MRGADRVARTTCRKPRAANHMPRTTCRGPHAADHMLGTTCCDREVETCQLSIVSRTKCMQEPGPLSCLFTCNETAHELDHRVDAPNPWYHDRNIASTQESTQGECAATQRSSLGCLNRETPEGCQNEQPGLEAKTQRLHTRAHLAYICIGHTSSCPSCLLSRCPRMLVAGSWYWHW